MKSQKLSKSFLFLMLVSATGFICCATSMTSPGSSERVPLPKDINIISPSSDLPKEIRAFSGKWQGTWVMGTMARKSILIVEEIGGQEAKIIYAYEADFSTTRGGGAEFQRYKARVISDPIPKIEYITSLGSLMTFEMQQDLKSLKGYFETTKGQIIKITTIMERAD